MATNRACSLKTRYEQLKALKFYHFIGFGIKGLEKAKQEKIPVKTDMRFFHEYYEATNECFACFGGLAIIEAFQLDMNRPKYRSADTHNFRKKLAKAIVKNGPDPETSVSYNCYDFIRKVESSLDDIRRRNFGAVFIDWQLNPPYECYQGPLFDQVNPWTSEYATSYYQQVYELFKKYDL